jgi:succinate dehydrogenase / fumarate reductase iron-sulfur subunit
VNLILHVWRQANAEAPGRMQSYPANDISPDMSFLEMLDVVNEGLIANGEDPIAFDHDCREGICGMCGLVINGIAHGPERATTTCQLHMRHFNDGQEVWIEPWRARAFPVLKDLVVDRNALDRIIQAGGYVSVNTGAAPEAASIPVPKDAADTAFESAACIGCGACVAACPNNAGQLFTSAKLNALNLMPQGQAQRWDRTINMVERMEEFFGSCTNHGECEEACPKEISIDFIAYMNRDYVKATMKNRKLIGQTTP